MGCRHQDQPGRVAHQDHGGHQFLKESDHVRDCTRAAYPPVSVNGRSPLRLTSRTASRLARWQCEASILDQQGIDRFAQQILLGPAGFARELVEELDLGIIQVQRDLCS